MKRHLKIFLAASILLSVNNSYAQKNSINPIEQTFLHPPASAKPWVFWYWMHAAVSKEGITADLEAMKQVGIGGAYLMPIQDTLSTIPFSPAVRQLTPEWWAMIKFAMQEAKRLDLKLAMHVSDGFALAGGPWITAELSMQKLVWTKTYITSPNNKIKLSQPETYKGYYKDVAVFAYPANVAGGKNMIPVVTASNGTAAQFLSTEDKNNRQSFKSDSACWIQYQYEQPFTCRSIQIHVGGNSYEAQRLMVQASDDGNNFKTIIQLQSPRHGWQDTDEDVTNAIPATTAKYFRFVYNKEGSEPGSEDLDAAKWKPSLKVMGIYLSGEPVINQYESKNGSVWRVSANTTAEQVPANAAVPLKNIINLSSKMDAAGNLQWTAPAGQWIIVRIGHTSTGHTNATGGGGIGLECDKFNPAAIKLQFDNWFAKAFSETDPKLAKEVLKVFHVDSWEAGSQNWNDNFKNEFFKRRGYDLMPYLLTMTGTPVSDAVASEKVLHDVRQTIAELVNDVFYVTLKKLAHEKGCRFSAESVAPTMMSDGLLHYKNVDLPMGEFWLNSPTHDKPNDMLDAISGAHIYGKNIIGAESFTSVRMNWGEHPGNLKAVGDRNFALGINKMVLHVFTHNPWMDKKPGMTLDGVGLYFQRDQTWFKQSKAWIDYLTRCSALLQLGKPVVDIAVFTGEEVPRRSILPDRLVNVLPGIFGQEKVEAEKKRLANIGQPMRQVPDGVSHSANMADPGNWVDPLNGYAYDSFNPDALMMMEEKNGRIVLPGGASYKFLVIPAGMKMNPANRIGNTSVRKLIALAGDGATILIDSVYKDAFAANGYDFIFKNVNGIMMSGCGSGKFVLTPYWKEDFTALGLEKDMIITPLAATIELATLLPKKLALQHREIGGKDIYFISNQNNQEQTFSFYFNDKGLLPEIYDPVTGKISRPFSTNTGEGGLSFFESFAAYESKFIVFENKGIPFSMKGHEDEMSHDVVTLRPLAQDWALNFQIGKDTIKKIIPAISLKSWTEFVEPEIKYYSGTVLYSTTYKYRKLADSVKSMYLEFDSVYNIASIKINGIDCGTLWTRPYKVDVLHILKEGMNTIEIAVTNTWHNRLIGDGLLPGSERKTFTTAPFRLGGKPLEPAGLFGRVRLREEYYNKDKKFPPPYEWDKE
jgi:hypothetical protein